MFFDHYITALVLSFIVTTSATSAKDSNRDGKLFSLFNIVTFKNDGCRSTSTISSGGTGSLNRNGTCFTANECESKGGTSSGSCAAGFGVCCVFLVTDSGVAINQNCTYIRNPGFPSTYGGSSGVSHTINKCSDDICWLRLDFESFTLLGTGNTVETDGTTGGGLCLDSFTVSTNTGQSAMGIGAPVICGQNTGQHMYVDMGTLASDTATLSFAFKGESTLRAWEVKVSQIPCAASYAPDPGCLQYHTGLTGRLTSFNFLPTTDNHLSNQNYNVCIRPEAGFCCVQYQVCSDPGSFTIAAGATEVADPLVFKALQDTSCTSDYIDIAGSSASCSQGSQNANPLTNRFCGGALNVMFEGDANIPICDCTAPFMVGIVTDALTDLAPPDAITANILQSRGVCLEWSQIPCS